MEQDKNQNRGRLYTGLFLIAAGLLLFAYKMGAPLPGWIFTWPVILIAIGVLISLKNGLRNPGGIVLIIIGGLNLADQLNPGMDFHNYIAPLIIILVGVIFIFRPSRGSCRHHRRWREKYGNEELNSPGYESPDYGGSEKKNDEADFIDSTSVFGGVKKVILSKNFKGGDITCFMGGTELNLTQADIQGRAELDVTQIFGGTKIIVPANWDIKTEVITIFGGVDDKRPVVAGNINANKLLIIRGISIFGGIDIRSY